MPSFWLGYAHQFYWVTLCAEPAPSDFCTFQPSIFGSYVFLYLPLIIFNVKIKRIWPNAKITKWIKILWILGQYNIRHVFKHVTLLSTSVLTVINGRRIFFLCSEHLLSIYEQLSVDCVPRAAWWRLWRVRSVFTRVTSLPCRSRCTRRFVSKLVEKVALRASA